MKTVHLVFLAAALLAPVAQADVYRWVDANGRTVFSDQPPPGGRASKLAIRGSSPAPVVASAPVAGGNLTDDVKAINARISDHNRKIKQDNCRMARQQQSNLENAQKRAKKPDPSLDESLVAAKDSVRTWCSE